MGRGRFDIYLELFMNFLFAAHIFPKRVADAPPHAPATPQQERVRFRHVGSGFPYPSQASGLSVGTATVWPAYMLIKLCVASISYFSGL